jgi:hypothetical protein
MKKVVFIIALTVAAGGFSCKKKEPAPVGPPQQQPAQAAPTTPATQPAQTSQANPETQPILGQPGEPSSGEMFELGLVAADGSSTTTITWKSGNYVRQEKYQGVGARKSLENIVISRPDGAYVLDPGGKTVKKLAPGSNPVEPVNPQYQKTDWDSMQQELSKAPGAKIDNQGVQRWEGQEYHVVRAGSEYNKMFRIYYIQDGTVKRVVGHDPHGRMSSDARINKKVGEDAIPPGAFDIPTGYKMEEPPTKF